MNNWDLRIFRNDLSIFIKLIEDENLIGDFTSLKTVLEELEQKDVIEYKVENLCFYIDGRLPQSMPADLNYYQIYYDSMLMVKHNLSDDIDPLHGYYMHINIYAYNNKVNKDKVYCSSWHHDRHYNTSNTKFTHPTYHFQFGGKKMELLDDKLSVLASPRIPHPPMDIFLCFHFILSNFYNNQQYSFVKNLAENHDYQQIIKRAQARLWKPYFNAFDTNCTNTEFTFKNVFPLYIG